MDAQFLTDNIVILAGQYIAKKNLIEFERRLKVIVSRYAAGQKASETNYYKRAVATKRLMDEIESTTARNKELYALLRQAQGENRKLREEIRTKQNQIMDLEIAKGKVEVVYE